MKKLARAILAILLTTSVRGQFKDVETFEVVSIKPTPDPPLRTGMFPTSGTLNIGNYTLKRLILETHRVKSYQLHGGPAWMDTEHYDIVAKAPGKAGIAEMMKMLIPMMADRFQLKVHRETKDIQVYALLVGKGGVKMQLAEPETKLCCSIQSNEIISHKMSMRHFADVLAGNLDRLVVDETGLTGEYRFQLKYAPEATPRRDADQETPASDLTSGSIFAAVQEQLGLKLESRKRPVEMIFVDHAEHPAAN
jgi:uncharacterized protein (TIGR03435 family)